MKTRISTQSLNMSWEEATWDTAVFGFPVHQISDMAVVGPDPASAFREYVAVCDRMGVGMVSCRLPHDRLRESMLLEDFGFRFIEMMFQPELLALKEMHLPEFQELSASDGDELDFEVAVDIAGRAFGNERFHVDPRISTPAANKRYQNWVRSTPAHPRQKLRILKEHRRVSGFFVTEMLDDRTCYWHLNAISPDSQGQGIGRRAWLTMLREARTNGAVAVRSSVAARNVRVLNLYGTLGFRLLPPTMTFHWVRDA